jgi:hypothetical protein
LAILDQPLAAPARYHSLLEDLEFSAAISEARHEICEPNATELRPALPGKAQKQAAQQFPIVQRHMAELKSDAYARHTSLGYCHDAAGLVAHWNRHAAHRTQLDVLVATEQESCHADVHQVTGKAETSPQECDWYRELWLEPFCSSACHVGYGSN